MTESVAHAAIAKKAEEEAHIDAELAHAREAQGLQEPVDAAELRKELAKSGSDLGGLTSSAEMMWVWNRYDAVRSEITTDQAGQRLKVRFEQGHPWAGQLVWTTREPEKLPTEGVLKCPLHVDSDEREYLNGLNFGRITCLKATLKTEYDRDTHFAGKHKNIFLAVEKDKDRQMQLQQMELMKQQTAAMQAMAEAQGAKPAEPQPTENRCASCQEVIEGKLADHKCS